MTVIPSGSDAAGATIASTSPARSSSSASSWSDAATGSSASLPSTTAEAPATTATFVVESCAPKMLPSIDRREHGEHEHAGRPEERLAADPHPDLAPRDEADAVDEARGGALGGVGRIGSAGVGRCVRAHRTTSRKIWASVVCSRVNVTTSPRAIASASTARRAASDSASKTAQPPSNSSTRIPGCLPEPAGVARHEQLPPLGRVLRAQCFAAARRADATVGDDHEVVAEPLDDVELVRREQHGCAGCRDIRQHALHRLDGHRVEARERLVEHEHLGAVHEGGGDLRSLLVAEREALDRVARCARRGRGARAARARCAVPRRASSRAGGRGTRSARAGASSGTGRAPRACSRSGGGRRR